MAWKYRSHGLNEVPWATRGAGLVCILDEDGCDFCIVTISQKYRLRSILKRKPPVWEEIDRSLGRWSNSRILRCDRLWNQKEELVSVPMLPNKEHT